MHKNRFIPFASLFFFCLTFPLLAPIDSLAKEGEANTTLRTEIGWVDLGGEEDRLRENHFGDRWKKRLNIQNVLSGHSKMNAHISFFLEPVSTFSNEENDVIIRRGYIRIVDGNTVLKVGRESLWWGPGRHGALLLSNNAFPFDLIQLGSDKPFQLPGPFSRLGTFEITSFLTELEANRDVPRPRLFGLRIGYHPFSWLSIGLSRITMFGGGGRPGITLKDFSKIYFSDPNQGGKFDVNELAGVDFTIQIPLGQPSLGDGLELYFEYGGEDEAGFRPSRPAFLGGFEWRYSGSRLIAEFASSHVRNFPNYWYNNGIYSSGYTYRGEIIGHHMGTDADDFFLRAETPLSKQWTIGIDLDQERHGLSSNAQEKFRRLGGDLLYLFKENQTYSFRYQYERIKNLDRPTHPVNRTLSTQTVQNQYVIVAVKWKF